MSLPTCLVIDQQLYGVVAPFNQHDLVGLPRDAVGEGGADARAGAGLDPHAQGEGVHLREGFGELAVQVVGALRQGQLELLRRLEIPTACRKQSHKAFNVNLKI